MDEHAVRVGMVANKRVGVPVYAGAAEVTVAVGVDAEVRNVNCPRTTRGRYPSNSMVAAGALTGCESTIPLGW